MYAGHVCSRFVPVICFSSACRDSLCGSGSVVWHSPKFTGVKECSDNYNLVYLKLGAKAGAPTFPDIGFKSPKGAVGLGDSALDFFVYIGLTVQGVSQVSHLSTLLTTRFLST